ncbi:MAG: NAD(P)H-dependent oxidoreductase subunit E [bacterium]|nr:NAD(P)H-dependent oxidoreductase subunit E [bacterium]
MTAPTTVPLTVAPADAVQEIEFDTDFEAKIGKTLKLYPNSQAALLPLLWLCQERWGWISAGMMKAVSQRLELAPSFVEGVVTFYTMYLRFPPGRYLLQVCTTLSCQLCGTSDLVEHLKKTLAIEFGETTEDGRFTLQDVQCLGACGEAPVIQINNDYYTDLTIESLDQVLDGLK